MSKHVVRGHNVFVDDCWDFLFEVEKWDIIKSGKTHYIKTMKRDGFRRVIMHRLISGAASNQIVDHINRNGLDNRFCNLRLCTRKENSRNRPANSGGISRYKGVHRKGAKWQASISVSGKVRYLGVFPTQQEAAHAYDSAAKLLHNEYAYLNFPCGGGDQNLY